MMKKQLKQKNHKGLIIGLSVFGGISLVAATTFCCLWLNQKTDVATTHTISLDAGKGSIIGVTGSIIVLDKTTVGSLPTPKWDGGQFDCWKDTKSSKEYRDLNEEITSDLSLVAVYIPNPVTEKIIMDQYKTREGASLFHSQEKINFKPNTKYEFYIDLSQFTPTNDFSCCFKTPQDIENWDDDDDTTILLTNPFDFVADGHHIFGQLSKGGAESGPGEFNIINFSEMGDSEYIKNADYIDGFITTLDWGTKTYPSAYAMFMVTPY